MELPDAGTFAYQLAEHVADSVGDDRADAYLTETVREVMDLAPAVREAIVADLMTELKEEISRDDSKFAAACRNAIMMVEERWRSGR